MILSGGSWRGVLIPFPRNFFSHPCSNPTIPVCVAQIEIPFPFFYCFFFINPSPSAQNPISQPLKKANPSSHFTPSRPPIRHDEFRPLQEDHYKYSCSTWRKCMRCTKNTKHKNILLVESDSKPASLNDFKLTKSVVWLNSADLSAVSLQLSPSQNVPHTSSKSFPIYGQNQATLGFFKRKILPFDNPVSVWCLQIRNKYIGSVK